MPGISLSVDARDSIQGVSSASDPSIVSISDIHGYVDAARSALLILTDHPDYDPLVTVDEQGTLHWAHNDYVIVFNGDLVDRGPANDAVLALIGRLFEEAPPGRVRVTVGNHEGIMLTPQCYTFDQWYSANAPASVRKSYLEWITGGGVVAAYEGYNVTYAHAGDNDEYAVKTVNESLIEAAERLVDARGTHQEFKIQSQVLEDYQFVLGAGDPDLKNPPAGLIWLHYRHIEESAPPQVIGHTRHANPKTKGDVHCQNVIRKTNDSPGGEGVFVETSQGLVALIRTSDGSVKTLTPPFGMPSD